MSHSPNDKSPTEQLLDRIDSAPLPQYPCVPRAVVTEQAPDTPAAPEGQAEPFAWIIARDSDDEWDGGEPMTDKDEADDYMENQCLPGWHLETLYRAAPLPRQAAVQEAQAEPNDSLVIAINRDSLMQIAKRLIGESLPDCDEEFMAARAHGIGSLHAEILMAAAPTVKASQ